MAFYIVKSAGSPGTYPDEIGGDANVVWHCDQYLDVIYELSTTDFSVVRYEDSPSTWPSGIGGDSNAIWHSDNNLDNVYELSTTDFSVVMSASAPSTLPYGIGGDANTIWHADNNLNKVYELSTTDLSVDRSADSPSTWPSGMGGDADTIWHTDSTTLLVYELSPTDFSVIRSGASPSTDPYGVGGDANTIWHSNSGTPDRLYELDSRSNEVTYYFNSQSTDNWTNPDRMVDGILTNYASHITTVEETLNANNCPGTNLGTIANVYLRAYAYGDDNDRLDLHPVFGGITQGSEYQTTPGVSAGWGEYVCITNDAQAPGTWTWADVVALDCIAEKDNVGKGNEMFVAKVEILVTYTPPVAPPEFWKKIAYESEPPTAGWNKVKRQAGAGWRKVLYAGE